MWPLASQHLIGIKSFFWPKAGGLANPIYRVTCGADISYYFLHYAVPCIAVFSVLLGISDQVVTGSQRDGKNLYTARFVGLICILVTFPRTIRNVPVKLEQRFPFP